MCSSEKLELRETKAINLITFLVGDDGIRLAESEVALVLCKAGIAIEATMKMSSSSSESSDTEEDDIDIGRDNDGVGSLNRKQKAVQENYRAWLKSKQLLPNHTEEGTGSGPTLTAVHLSDKNVYEYLKERVTSWNTSNAVQKPLGCRSIQSWLSGIAALARSIGMTEDETQFKQSKLYVKEYTSRDSSIAVLGDSDSSEHYDLYQHGRLISELYSTGHCARDAWLHAISYKFLGRGKNMRGLRLSDICHKTFDIGTVSKHQDLDCLVAVYNQGKPTKGGQHEFVGCFRDQNVLICSWAALSLVLFQRFELEKKANVSLSSTTWKDEYIVPRIVNRTRDFTKPLTSAAHIKIINSAIEKIGQVPLTSTKATNMCRGLARYAKVMGAPTGSISCKGDWGKDVLKRHYLKVLPVKAMVAVSGWRADKSKSLFLSRFDRSKVDMPSALEAKFQSLFSFADDFIESQGITPTDSSSMAFAKLLIRMRETIPEDAPALWKAYPNLSIWKHEIFCSEDWATWVSIQEENCQRAHTGYLRDSHGLPPELRKLQTETARIVFEALHGVEGRLTDQFNDVYASIRSDINLIRTTLVRIEGHDSGADVQTNTNREASRDLFVFRAGHTTDSSDVSIGNGSLNGSSSRQYRQRPRTPVTSRVNLNNQLALKQPQTQSETNSQALIMPPPLPTGGPRTPRARASGVLPSEQQGATLLSQLVGDRSQLSGIGRPEVENRKSSIRDILAYAPEMIESMKDNQSLMDEKNIKRFQRYRALYEFVESACDVYYSEKHSVADVSNIPHDVMSKEFVDYLVGLCGNELNGEKFTTTALIKRCIKARSEHDAKEKYRIGLGLTVRAPK
eukprot:CFRG2271T1